MIKKKCPDIPVLRNYEDSPTESFWKNFPKTEIPTEILTKINVDNLTELLNRQTELLTHFELERAKLSILNFRNGASSYQIKELPSCFVSNAKSSFPYGEYITDTVANWTIEEFVAGPFDEPPLRNFRVNALMPIDQKSKIRPVLNVSLPKNSSFNDNVNLFALEKVHMSNARKFGFSVREAGASCKMSKYDLVDAYKNIPVPLYDLRLQGFIWLSKYFVECRQIFGAKTAVANFDIFGNSILTLAIADKNFPRKFFHRTLDDVPFVAPAHTNWCEQFSECYEKMCVYLNVPLAKECPKFEKAFTNSTHGKVLGINFNTVDLTWNLPEDKKRKALECIKFTLNCNNLELLKMQELLGRLNNIAQMCPFLKCFTYPLYKNLAKIENSKGEKIYLSTNSKQDLNVWANFLLDKNEWHPICAMYYHPPISCKSFSSDAAGCNENSKVIDGIGCGNVGFDSNGKINFVYQLFWPDAVIKHAKDEKFCRIGNKTTTLEFLGILIPFLIMPEKLKNQYIEVKVDNVGCFFGWINRHVKGDVMATILIRALHLIGAYLGTQIHVSHLPRKSTWDALLVDRLSRKKSTTVQDRRLLKSFQTRRIPYCLRSWMHRPTEDWELPMALLKSVKEICEQVS